MNRPLVHAFRVFDSSMLDYATFKPSLLLHADLWRLEADVTVSYVPKVLYYSVLRIIFVIRNWDISTEAANSQTPSNRGRYIYWQLH